MNALRSLTLLLAAGLSATLVAAGCSGGNGGNDAGLDACDGCDPTDEGPLPCTSIADCPAHHLCLGGFCQLGTICTGTGDECPEGYVCNIMQEVCVPETPCESDADCTEAAAPVCLEADGVCVECVEDADCGGGEDVFCNASYQCDVVGPDCSTDADCTEAGKPHCDQAQGKCVACVNDGHCSGNQVCRPDTHSCVECYANNHCVNPNPYCWLDTTTCVECLEDNHCGGDERCNVSSHTCTDMVCESDADCVDQPGPHCRQDTGDCVACLEHDHCGALQWCREYSCQSGCETDAECVDKMGQGYRCDPENAECFYAECMDDADCAGHENGEHCKLTDLPSNPPQYTCVECTEDAHCDEFFMCKTTSGKFVCEPMPCYLYEDPEATCAEIDPCYVCDYGGGQCKPREDCSTEPCCQGYTCNAYSTCERNLDCDSNEDCPADSICNQQTLQCEFQSCCDECDPGWYCNEATCECVEGECKQLMESCNPDIQNCCEGLTCSLMGICFAY